MDTRTGAPFCLNTADHGPNRKRAGERVSIFTSFVSDSQPGSRRIATASRGQAMSIDELLSRLDDLPADNIPVAIAQLAAAQSTLAARLLTNGNGSSAHMQSHDRLLTA